MTKRVLAVSALTDVDYENVTVAELSDITSSGGGSSSIFSGARVINTGNQGASTSGTLLYNTETFDTDNYHSTTTNTGRFTVPAGLSGYFLLTLNARLSSGGGIVIIGIRKNGTEQTRNGAQSIGNTELNCSTVFYMAAGDYADSWFYYSGGGVTSEYYADYVPVFTITRLGQ